MEKIKVFIMSMLCIGIIFPSVTNAMTMETYKNSCDKNIVELDDLINDDEFIEDIREIYIKEYGKDYENVIKKNKLAVTAAEKIESQFGKDKMNNSIYPNYIGGLYIDDDDNLVIQLVKDNIPKIKSTSYNEFSNIMSVDSNAYIEYVENSYERLMDIHNIALESFLNENNGHIVGLYVDVKLNKVVVELKEIEESDISTFKKNVIDSDLIVYKKAEKFVDYTNPGASMYLGEADGLPQYCSWGYRAKNSSGQTGMVTAAHCIDDRSGFSYVEPYSTLKKQNSGTIDAAWINISSPTNTLNQKPSFSGVTTLSTTVMSSFYTGQKIAKLGRTTGYTVGSVTNPSYSGTFGTKFTDLVLSSLPVNNGDSGGIVMEQIATFGNGFGTMGIVKAGQSGTTNMVFSKASNINSIFGISRY